MDGLAFLAALVAIVIIVVWEIANDKVPFNGKTRGFLAMKQDDGATRPPSRRRRRENTPP